MTLRQRIARVTDPHPFPLCGSRLVRVRRNLGGMVVSSLIPRGTVELCGLPVWWRYAGESETIQRPIDNDQRATSPTTNNHNREQP